MEVADAAPAPEAEAAPLPVSPVPVGIAEPASAVVLAFPPYPPVHPEGEATLLSAGASPPEPLGWAEPLPEL